MRKDFKKDNPALAFISTPVEPLPEEAAPIARTAVEAPDGYRLNPLFVENKSKRVQLLVQPSVLEAVKAIASKKGISTNEAMNEAIRAYVENERGKTE